MLDSAQVDQGLSRKHVEALHLRIKEYRHELALCRKEAKRAAKALKHAEVGTGVGKAVTSFARSY